MHTLLGPLSEAAAACLPPAVQRLTDSKDQPVSRDGPSLALQVVQLNIVCTVKCRELL